MTVENNIAEPIRPHVSTVLAVQTKIHATVFGCAFIFADFTRFLFQSKTWCHLHTQKTHFSESSSNYDDFVTSFVCEEQSLSGAYCHALCTYYCQMNDTAKCAFADVVHVAKDIRAQQQKIHRVKGLGRWTTWAVSTWMDDGHEHTCWRINDSHIDAHGDIRYLTLHSVTTDRQQTKQMH